MDWYEDSQTILVVSAIVMEAEMYEQKAMTSKNRLYQQRLRQGNVSHNRLIR